MKILAFIGLLTIIFFISAIFGTILAILDEGEEKMKEIDKLAEMLNKEGIKFERKIEQCNYYWEKSDLRNQIVIRGIEKKISCICNIGSYGVEDGLIEFWDFSQMDPVGYLTAEEAFELIKKTMKTWE